jgi:hypothetical protein
VNYVNVNKLKTKSKKMKTNVRKKSKVTNRMKKVNLAKK